MLDTAYVVPQAKGRQDEPMDFSDRVDTLAQLTEFGVHVDGPHRARRTPVSQLRSLGAALTGVPFREVEVTDRCASCGNAHGPLRFTAIGTAEPIRWVGDAVSIAGVGFAAAGKVRGLAAVMWTAQVAPAAYIDDAAFHPDELTQLSLVPDETRELARATHFIRKGALVRLCGHFDTLEPALLSVSTEAEGRVLRAVPALGSAWRDIRVFDLDAGPGMVGAIAVLP